jgi:sugar transferase EpsL
MIAKRIFDFIVASVLLILLSPLLLVIAVVVAISLGSPVLFRQKRGAKGNGTFQFLKFRTMTDACDGNGDLLPDEIRLTGIGKMLRSTSLDELPQLWSVIRGDMSLVGPRPLLAEYLPLYDDRQKLRHLVRPGITGWAQVQGRNAVSWEQKFQYDVWYVENRTFWLDCRILFRTVQKVIRREGVSSDGHATMPKFSGSAPSNASR